jgi:hypothetical protein
MAGRQRDADGGAGDRAPRARFESASGGAGMDSSDGWGKPRRRATETAKRTPCCAEALPGRARRFRPDAKDRLPGGDPRELVERRRRVERDVRSRPRRKLQIALQDRSTNAGVGLLQTHGFTAAVPENGPSVRGPNIGHPVHVRAQHRDEIALAVVVGDYHGRRDWPPAMPTTNFQGVQWLRRDAPGRQPPPSSVQEPRDGVRAPALIHPAVEPMRHGAR